MIYLCVGRRELGKTTLALYLTRNMRPRVIFDPRGLCPAPNGRVTSAAEISQAFDLLNEDATGIEKRYELVITPDADTQATFEYTCGEIKSWLTRGKQVSFIVDESTFMKLDVEPFEWIIRCAPRRDAYIVLTQHRPTDVPPRIRAIADIWCVFRTIEPRDLQCIAERCTESFAAKVSKLKPREFMSWDDTKADDNTRTHTDPSAWHVPLAIPGSGVASTGVELPAGNSTVGKNLLSLSDDG